MPGEISSPRSAQRAAVALMATAIVLSAGAAQAFADRGAPDPAARAAELLNRLQVTGQQARQMVPLFEDAAQLWAEQFDQLQDLQPELIAALQAFLAEDQLDTGFSQEVERSTARLHHRQRELKDGLTAALRDLELQVLALLTPEQRHLLTIGKEHKPRRGSRDRRSKDTAEQAARRALEQTRQEMAELRAGTHPELGVFGERLLHPGAAEVLYPLAGVSPSAQAHAALTIYARGTLEYPAAKREADGQTIRRLSHQINLWNLVNGLHLSPEQAEHIATLAALAEQLRPGNKRDRWASRRRPRTRRPYTLFDLEQEVLRTLSDSQKRVLADYQPCLIPPKNLKDPVRVGQANDASPGVRLLERARRVPPGRTERLVDAVLQREQKHLGSYSSEEYQARRSALLEAIDAVRQMDEVEFALNKEQLAADLQPPDRKRHLQARVDELSAAAHVPGRAAHFLLQPDIIDVLRVRIAQLRQQPGTTPPDLRQGPQADHCEPGKCAID